MTIYLDEDKAYNVIIEHPDKDWMNQTRAPVQIPKDKPWTAYYRKDMIALRALTDYDISISVPKSSVNKK